MAYECGLIFTHADPVRGRTHMLCPPQNRRWRLVRCIFVLLIGLRIVATSNVRARGLRALLRDTYETSASVKHIPCDEPGCMKGVEGKIYAFSALHDVTLREVALFVDIAFEGDDPLEKEVECLYWSGDLKDSTGPRKAAGKAIRIFDDKRIYAPYIIKCSDPFQVLKGMPKWVGLELEGKDTKIRLLVEQVSLQQQGTVGACNAVVNSDKSEMLYEWLQHYTDLGVDGFHIYFTNQSVNWNDSSSRDKYSDENVPKPFNFPRVSWVHFEHLPLEDRFLYSQQSVYNDCVYRLRHSYEYLVMFDMDEFLVIRDPRFARSGGLKSLLHHVFPPHYAAVGVYRYAYRDDCRKDPLQTKLYHEKATHRLKEPESQSVLNSKHFADKLIIKPNRVDIFYMHFLASVREGYVVDASNTLPSMVFLKHLRKYDQSCQELTDELPFDQD